MLCIKQHGKRVGSLFQQFDVKTWYILPYEWHTVQCPIKKGEVGAHTHKLTHCMPKPCYFKFSEGHTFMHQSVAPFCFVEELV